MMHQAHHVWSKKELVRMRLTFAAVLLPLLTFELHLSSVTAFAPPLKQRATMKNSNKLAVTFAAGIVTSVALRRLYSTVCRTKSSDDEDCIYLDYNGTTSIHPRVLEAMMPYLTTHFGNPSSSHHFGKQPKEAVEQARRSLLNMLGAPPSTPLSSIWFTGCGTESDNLAIQLALDSSPYEKKHIVTSNVEHPAIDVCLRRLVDDDKVQVTFVPVDNQGRVSSQDMITAIQPNTVLVTLMLANNESGAIQPVAAVAKECRKRGILCHTDAAQAVGKMNVSLDSLGDVDMITLVGHKIGAPKGVAALYVRSNCCHEHGRNLRDGCVLLFGGGQECGRRGGTENVPYIVAMGQAADIVQSEWKTNAVHMEEMRERLLKNLTKELGDDVVRSNGPIDSTLRLPNTLSVGLRGVQSGNLLANIGDRVAASAGAACHSSGAGGISSVLMAMDVPEEFARGTLRLSVGPTTSAEDVDKAAAIIASEAKKQLADVKQV
jgi:cysteine desulfurase